MAAIASSSAAHILPSTALRAAEGLPAFCGLKAVSGFRPNVSSKTLKVRKTCSICALAEGTCDGHSNSAGTTSVALFASVSESSGAAATAPTTSAAALIPTVLGAGLLGAAAVAFLKGRVTSAAPTPPIPVVAPAPVLTGNAFLPDYGAIIPRAKSAASSALATMSATFPGATTEETFVKQIANELAPLGFQKDNCIALVNTCRDEVCRPLVNLIDKEFGLSFNIAGLGGLVNCGKTGFKAAMSHSPEFPCLQDGTPKERYIFLAFPHVSVGESGEVGSLLRRGRGKPSSACGALIAIKGDINSGVGVKEDKLDAEYVLLKKKVINKLPKSSKELSLSEVTKAALEAITEDLEKLISLTVDPKTSDYAVITGIQIHSGAQVPGEPFLIERTCDYIAPHAAYAVVNGTKYELKANARKDRALAK